MSKENKKQTPMMEQYWAVRNSLPPDTLLMFRLGDFYEMFYGDAEEGSKILGITLTKRQDYPMAGVPYHAADQYIPKLLAAGKKVAICEQDEIPQAGKLVKRSISRILTPGTVLEDNQLESGRASYIMALDIDKKRRLYCAWCDISTGEFYCSDFDNPEDFLPIFSACDPREVLIPEEASAEWGNLENLRNWHAVFRGALEFRPVTKLHDYRFDPDMGERLLRELLGVAGLEGFGIPSGSRLAGPAGALVFYASENLRAAPGNIRRIKRVSSGNCVLIDPATQRSLELFKTTSGARGGSLLSVLDRCASAAGSRLVEAYLSAPTTDTEEIRHRQDAVWELYSEPSECRKARECISQFRDIARILGRLQNRLRNPRELLAVYVSLEQLEPIREALISTGGAVCRQFAEAIPNFADLRSYLNRAVSENAPTKIQDGGMIREGFDEELDRLRNLSNDNVAWLAEFERREQEATGIKNLRVKFNGAFGYFIEISRAAAANAPAHYVRRQTMTNAERFTTDELRRKENEILHAEDKAKTRELELFGQVVDKVLERSTDLLKAADIVAQVDAFSGWAQLARDWNYCRPVVDNSDAIEIFDGRHPVVEQTLRNSGGRLCENARFVPNDAFLSSSQQQIALITGPNMAGKSTYIRQVALITLMAQIGCFVPAKKCKLGVVDRIFSRVGANDELSKGNSTFMVEMNETANILNNATDKSLIILDEIGRGTSTYDGLSIAWAVVEYIHGDGDRGPKTLFATHYHEITKLEETLQRLSNFRVCVKEWKDEVIFVRRIERGAADKSYGIQVARLAGLPGEVIERAKEVLSELETEGKSMAGNLGDAIVRKSPRKRGGGESNFRQLTFF